MGKYDDFELDLSVKSAKNSDEIKLTNFPESVVTN